MPMKTLWTSNSQQTRAEAEAAAGKSEHGYLYRLDWCSTIRCAELKAYRIIKITPCGFRIALDSWTNSKTRFVLKDGHRKFAHDTLAKAAESYLARKTWYKNILQRRLEEAEDMIQAVKKADVKKQFDFILDDTPYPMNPRLHWPKMKVDGEVHDSSWFMQDEFEVMP